MLISLAALASHAPPRSVLIARALEANNEEMATGTGMSPIDYASRPHAGAGSI